MSQQEDIEEFQALKKRFPNGIKRYSMIDFIVSGDLERVLGGTKK